MDAAAALTEWEGKRDREYERRICENVVGTKTRVYVYYVDWQGKGAFVQRKGG